MSDTLQTFCVSKPILLTSISILWRTWSPAHTHRNHGGSKLFYKCQYFSKIRLNCPETFCVKFSVDYCVCDLGDRDERAGLRHQRCLPDTRHDRPGRTGPPAGTGELWPGSGAWPTPGIAWTSQSGICGEHNVKSRTIGEIQPQNILLQLHALGIWRKTRQAHFFKCSVIFKPLNRSNNVAAYWWGTKTPLAHLLLRISRLHWF